MTVRVENLQGGSSAPQLFFNDNFDRAVASAWGPNWLQALATFVNGAAVGAQYTDPRTNGTQGEMVLVGTTGGGNQTQVLTVMLPIRVFVNLYNKPRTFAKVKWISVTNTLSSALILRFNQELANGVGTNLADYYRLDLDNGSGGRILRITGVGNTVLQAATWANPAANDIIEFRATYDPTVPNVTLQSFRNGGAAVSTVVDAAVGANGHIAMGSPGFGFFNGGQVPPSVVQIDDYQCGVF